MHISYTISYIYIFIFIYTHTVAPPKDLPSSGLINGVDIFEYIIYKKILCKEV